MSDVSPESEATGAEQSLVRLHGFVTGKVQHVHFRKYTQQAATKLGVTGWVKNLPDGRVEWVCEGPRAACDALASWCASKGSPASVIASCEVNEESYRGKFPRFDVDRSYMTGYQPRMVAK